MERKCLIAMSGGVDSSVAAHLMVQNGCACIGCTMKLYDNGDVGVAEGKTCCSLSDVEDARSVSVRLGMPYYVFNFREEFDEKVIGNFVRAYECGQTPNPCIDCNRYLKFGGLYHRARELGCDDVVTGHYARIEQDKKTGRWLLKKALDDSKDQSYVLYSLTQEQLAHTKFPLGTLCKTEVRRIAEENGFLNAKKPDSQDICFVPDGDYAAFLERRCGKCFPTGAFLDEDGSRIGTHRGIIHYTVGQRRGLGIAAETPLYVKSIDPERNTVTLSKNEALFTTELTARNLNFIAFDRLDTPLRCAAKIRYRHREAPATVTQTDADEMRVVFDTPQRAITAGQSVVLYDGDTVLGGGMIC